MPNVVSTVFSAEPGNVFSVADQVEARVKRANDAINGLGQGSPASGGGSPFTARLTNDFNSLERKALSLGNALAKAVDVPRTEAFSFLTQSAEDALKKANDLQSQIRVIQTTASRTSDATVLKQLSEQASALKSQLAGVERDLLQIRQADRSLGFKGSSSREAQKAEVAQARETRSVLQQIEKERLASRTNTDRAIAASVKAIEDFQRREAKQTANSVIADLKAIERERAASGRTGNPGIASTASSGLASGLGLPIGGPAAIIAAVTAATVVGGKALIDYSSKLEQAKVGFVTLTGSTVAAQKHLEDLQRFAARTPFKFDEILDASRKMQALGFSAEKVIPVLTDVGNILAGSGRIDELPFAIKALSDIQAKGKLAGQEIIQLANAGIGIRDVLAKQLNVSTSEVIELGEQGKISAGLVFEAIHKLSEEKFGDALARQSQTFGGAFENIADQVRISSAKAFDPLYQELSNIAVRANEEINKSGGDLEATFVVLGQAIGQALKKGVVLGIKNFNIYAVLKNEFDQASEGKDTFAGAILGNLPSAQIAEGLKALVAAELDKVGYHEAARKVTRSFQEALAEELSGLNPTLVNAAKGVTFDGLTTYFDPITNTIQQITAEVKTAADETNKLTFERAAAEANALDQELKKIDLGRVAGELELAKARAAGNENQIEGIRQAAAAEEIAIEKQIKLTKDLADLKLQTLNSETDPTGNQAKILQAQTAAEIEKLTTQITVSRINARRQEQEEIKKTIDKLREMEKAQNAAVTALAVQSNSDNPFVAVMQANQAAIAKLRQDLKGLPQDFIESQVRIQQGLSQLNIYSAKLSTAFDSISLRATAARFREPTQKERLADLDKEIAEINRTGGTRGRNREAILEYLNRKGKEIEDMDKIRQQGIVDQQISAASTARNDKEQARADRQLLTATSGLSPDDLRLDQREQIAQAAERQAQRQDRYYTDSLQIMSDTRDAVQAIANNTSNQEAAAKKGEKTAVTVTVKNESDTKVNVSRPSKEDVDAYYYLGFGKGVNEGN